MLISQSDTVVVAPGISDSALIQAVQWSVTIYLRFHSVVGEVPTLD